MDDQVAVADETARYKGYRCADCGSLALAHEEIAAALCPTRVGGCHDAIEAVWLKVVGAVA